MTMTATDCGQLTAEVVRLLGKMKACAALANGHMKTFAKHTAKVREILYIIDKHRGWEAAGYGDMVEFAQAEYGFEVKDLEEQIQILDLEVNLSTINQVANYLPGLSPVVTPGSLTPGQAEALLGLSADQQRAAFVASAEQGDVSEKGLRAAAAEQVFRAMSLEEQKAFLENRERELEAKRSRDGNGKTGRKSRQERRAAVIERITRAIAWLKREAEKSGLAVDLLEAAEAELRAFEKYTLPLFASGSAE